MEMAYPELLLPTDRWIWLVGFRESGKTTLLKRWFEQYADPSETFPKQTSWWPTHVRFDSLQVVVSEVPYESFPHMIETLHRVTEVFILLRDQHRHEALAVQSFLQENCHSVRTTIGSVDSIEPLLCKKSL